jgi:protein involved in polysaccharide export with SLBB domain
MRLRLAFAVLLYLSCSLYAQLEGLPPDIANKIEGLKKGQSARSSLLNSETSYSAPAISTESELPRSEDRQQHLIEITTQKKSQERRFGIYREPVVFADDTVQWLIKAQPETLQIYGASLFDNLSSIKAIPKTGVISEEYILGIGDELIIDLWGNVNYQYSVTIDNEGKISIPKYGTLQLSGFSLKDAKKKLKALLSGSDTDLSVSLTVSKFKNLQVFVIGEVNKPGAVSLGAFSSVLDALTSSEGISDIGSFRNISVIRQNAVISNLDLYELLTLGKTKGNISLSSGDIIYVPPAYGYVKIRGAVRRPAIYEIVSNSTFEEVISMSGGILPDANSASIMLDRVIEGKHTILNLNWNSEENKTFSIIDMDDISVFESLPIRKEMVFLTGQISQPGPYSFIDGMTLCDLLYKKGILTGNSFLGRVNIVRYTKPNQRTIFSVDLRDEDENDCFLLASGDSVNVFPILDENTFDFVSISGYVRKPVNTSIIQE